jgi:hypothetical protein
LKSIFGKIAFLALTLTVALSAANVLAYADGEVGVVPGNPCWYLSIDDGKLANAPFFGQNTVQDYISEDAQIVLILHPEFYPEPDEPDTAVVATAITDFLVWDREDGEYKPCTKGTVAFVPAEYAQETDVGEWYLQFQVSFDMFSEKLGEIIKTIYWEPAYFKIPEISDDVRLPAVPEVPEEEFEGGIN